MSDCPSMKEIEGLASGSLTGEPADRITSHVRDCADCREALEDCRQNLAFLARAKPVLVRSGGAKSPTSASDSDAEPTREMTSPGEPMDARSFEVAKPDIAGHRIMRELHRGGQGIVYEAMQESTKRKVAIKLLLDGQYASAAARKRFDREVELVASLKHPNIISIFQSGITADGRQFYVMDYVRGVPLHRYIQDRHIPLRDALAVFATICEAVNYAHQRGIIHRDLKPSNILVDASGEPRVLDFGLAKMINTPEATVVSMTGQVVGTLPYISPEQARGNPEEVDTRTDVYALGVILYQLLTGHYPYPVIGQLSEVLRHIEETPPTPPSKAWKADSGITSSGEGRLRAIQCPIDDEVQTIVLKALAKERERRYQSVGELARDVRSYLAGRPIEAKRDSSIYVLRKMFHRYRAQVGVAAVLALVFAAAVTTFAVQRQRLGRQQAALQVEQAGRVLAGFAQHPSEGIKSYSAAAPGVQQKVAELSGQYAASDAYIQRLAGAGAALMYNPDAFWSSIDGGPLWHSGEWLQIARMQWPDPNATIERLRAKLRAGTPRQQYVAACLLGRLAPAGHAVAAECLSLVGTSAHPGVVAAARWAAGRLGSPTAWPAQIGIVTDDIAQLTFVRVPESAAYRPGPPADDADTWHDETTSPTTVPIAPFYIATTETTLAAFTTFVGSDAGKQFYGPFDEAFAADPANQDLLLAANRMHQQIDGAAPAVLRNTAANWVSLSAARAYCTWLSDRAKAAGLSRRYRLPTEIEWEYAARGGNDRRFCYGDDPQYASFFGNLQGDVTLHEVAQHMPNFWGLYDVHGGLWEWCDTPYPASLVRDPAVTPQLAKQLFVLHGGAFYSPAVRCRVSQRNYGDTRSPGQYWGFRVVMELVSP